MENPEEAGDANTAGASYPPRAKSMEFWARTAAALAVSVLLTAIAWLSFLNQPANDFTEYYCAGQIVRAGLGNRLYDFASQFQCESQFGAVHVFYNHPAFETLLFLPFTYLNYTKAYLAWMLLSIILLLAVVRIIEAQLHASAVITEYTRVPADLGMLFVIFLTFAPVTTCLSLGQDSILMLFIYSAVFLLLDKNRHFLAGCVLACGLYKFQAVIPFAFILGLRRRWTTVGGFLLGGLCLMLISLAVSGTGSLSGYPSFLLTELRENIGGFNPSAMPNIRGLFTLLVHGKIGNIPSALLIFFFSMLTLWWTARGWRDDEFRLSLAAGLIATVLASFHLYNYELSLLLLPIAIVCSELTRNKMLRNEKVLTGSLIVLFIAPLHRFLSLQNAYGLMCLPILAMFWVTMSKIRVFRYDSR
jgi:Glycosyltransferase family 87